MEQEARPHSQICWVLRSDFFLPLEGEKAFFIGTFKVPHYREVPMLDKCHCNSECSENLTF